HQSFADILRGCRAPPAIQLAPPPPRPRASPWKRHAAMLCRTAVRPFSVGWRLLLISNFAGAHMIKRPLGCVLVFGGLMAGASVQAHHSTAGIYDPAKEVTVMGALSKLQFVNPHGSITVTVKNADGTTTDWTFTTGSATALAQRGITKVGPSALKIGEEVTVK